MAIDMLAGRVAAARAGSRAGIGLGRRSRSAEEVDRQRVPAVDPVARTQQIAEMKWFIDAAKKLQAKGVKEISVVSETITTHEYESKTLAKAFEEITGIKVKHDLIQEGDVVEKLQTSMQSGKSIYDGWITDSDLIGTHYRYGKIDAADRLHGRRGQGVHQSRASTSRTSSAPASPPRPTASSTSCPTSSSPTCTGSAPTCSRARTCKDKFKAKYGYDLGVPLNWWPTRTSPSSSPTT